MGPDDLSQFTHPRINLMPRGGSWWFEEYSTRVHSAFRLSCFTLLCLNNHICRASHGDRGRHCLTGSYRGLGMTKTPKSSFKVDSSVL